MIELLPSKTLEEAIKFGEEYISWNRDPIDSDAFIGHVVDKRNVHYRNLVAHLKLSQSSGSQYEDFQYELTLDWRGNVKHSAFYFSTPTSSRGKEQASSFYGRIMDQVNARESEKQAKTYEEAKLYLDYIMAHIDDKE